MTRWKLHRIEAAIYLIAMFSLPFGLAWGINTQADLDHPQQNQTEYR